MSHLLTCLVFPPRGLGFGVMLHLLATFCVAVMNCDSFTITHKHSVPPPPRPRPLRPLTTDLRRISSSSCYAFHRGSPVSAPSAGHSENSTGTYTQPCSSTCVLFPTAPAVYEHEHELHCVLPQVSAHTTFPMTQKNGKRHDLDDRV